LSLRVQQNSLLSAKRFWKPGICHNQLLKPSG
jgi:hypothetical protein